MNSPITCAEFEILLADYLDGTLDASRRELVENHRSSCAACIELAEDVSSAIAFIERAAEVEPPPAMVNRILFEVSSGPGRSLVKPSWMGRWLWLGSGNVLQPRFGMSLAMAILSFAMMVRFWPAADNGVHRAWDRAVKSYENLQVVYDVQARLQEWGEAGFLDPAGDRGRAENSGAENK